MNIEFIETGQDLTVKLRGDLDHHYADEARKTIDKKIIDDDIINLTIDMGALDFIDSSGIGFVIGRYKVIRKKEGRLFIINASSKIRKILDMSGIGKIIIIK